MKYSELNEFQRTTLHIIAIGYAPIRTTDIYLIFKFSGVLKKELSKAKRKVLTKIKATLTFLEKNEVVANDGGWHCIGDHIDYAFRDAVQHRTFKKLVSCIQKQFPQNHYWYIDEQEYLLTTVRDFRIYAISGNNRLLAEGLNRMQLFMESTDVILKVFLPAFGVNLRFWMPYLTEEFVVQLLAVSLQRMFLYFDDYSKHIPIAKELIQKRRPGSQILAQYLLNIDLLRGNREFSKNIKDDHTAESLCLLSATAFMKCDKESGVRYYREALNLERKKPPFLFYSSLASIFYVLALIGSGDMSDLKRAEKYCNLKLRHNSWVEWIIRDFSELLCFLQGKFMGVSGNRQEKCIAEYDGSVIDFFRFFTIYWMEDTFSDALKNRLDLLIDRAKNIQFKWVADELLGLRHACFPDEKNSVSIEKSSVNIGFKAFIPKRSEWEIRLDALINSMQELQLEKQSGSKERLTWRIKAYESKDFVMIRPYIQKLSAKGTWSKGRAVPLKRIGESIRSMDFLSDQDVKIAQQIANELLKERYFHSGFQFDIEWEYILPLMVNHPLVFRMDSPDQKVEIIEEKPQIRITHHKMGYKISVTPDIPIGAKLTFRKDGPNRLVVYRISDELRRIAAIIGKKTLILPEKSEQKIKQAISSISTAVTVHSDIVSDLEGVIEIPADSRIYARLLPMGQGISMDLLVKPIPDANLYYPPGIGGRIVLTEVNGERVQATRDFDKEAENENNVLEQVPFIMQIAEQGDPPWNIYHPADCLELLSQLKEAKNSVIVEWPKGEKFKITKKVSFDMLKLKVESRQNWFDISGAVEFDDKMVWEMKELLQRMQESAHRFIRIGENEFIELSKTLKRQLTELNSRADMHGNGLRIHKLAAFNLSDLLENVSECALDAKWKKFQKELSLARAYSPEIPGTFQGELREYQKEGFHWLAKLSRMGAGACLADDMGLGKTIQALAVMLLHAEKGPILVVAPTSVCMNWEVEATRFAPTLNLKHLHGDRNRVIQSLKPFDVLIISYNILYIEYERLIQVAWEMVVLDEAQAIKNYTSKRSQAAMKLQSNFRMITTGTPIENHLAELWNLFRFINPGLLGSLDKFKKKFIIPIEKNKDKEALHNLKNIVKPFLLRRTKTKVLHELPEKTEINLFVELSAEEMAFYEALRQKAIENLDNAQEGGRPQHIRILAEIMRLRRACCNTKLVMPESSIPSSKLSEFSKIVHELLENNHKALVFSQFVTHLSIIRKFLDSENIKYQYLDGATPAGQRRNRVTAFQSGKGDLFLISLKAGGQGLNLTAADYVIHMDPWWNPAVEDQASDRIHRIGQKRPVTVYRLIAKNTIEEKILALHRTKRDLAEQLLSGSDITGKMSASDLLKLIKETAQID